MKTTGEINEDRKEVCGRFRSILNGFSYFVEIRLQGLNLAGKRILELVRKVEGVGKRKAAA